MNKKSIVIGSVASILLGAIGAIGYQVHAENNTGSTTVVQTSIATTTDTDNIQDENGGPEKVDLPDVGDKEIHDEASSTDSHIGDGDKETQDNGISTSSPEQNNQPQNELGKAGSDGENSN